MATKRERLFRMVAFFFGWFECMVFAGCTYGWVALVFVLKEDGIYSHLCDRDIDDADIETKFRNLTSNEPVLLNDYNVSGNGTQSMLPYKTCTEQNDMLMLVFTIGASALTVSTLFIGWLFDKFGTRITRIVSMVLFTSGSLMLGFADADKPVLVFPGLCCFGIGGIILLVTNMQIGNYFDAARLTIVTVYNSSFDSSSAILLIMKVLHGAGVKRLHCFIGLCILNVVVVSISTFAFLPKFKVFPKDRRNKGKKDVELLVKDNEDGGIKVGNLTAVELNNSNETEAVNGKEKEALTTTENKVDEPSAKKVQGLKYYVFSRVYLFELMWHAIIQLQFFYYMGTLNTMLNDFTNNDTAKVSFLTNAFSYILMCGILFGPLEGLILHLEKKRLHTDNPTYYDQIRPAALPQGLCCILCLLLSILVLIPVEGLLYVQFICLMIFRAFLYGLNSAFLFMAFPVEHFGRLFGVLMTVNGVIGALQYPLFKWGEGPPKNYVPPSVFMIIMVTLTLVQPISVMFGEKFDKLVKCCKQRKSSSPSKI